MPLDPQAKAYLERLAELGLRPLQQLTPDEAGQQSEAAAPVQFGPVEDVFSVVDEEIAGMIHGFARMPAVIDRSAEVMAEIGSTLRAALTLD